MYYQVEKHFTKSVVINKSTFITTLLPILTTDDAEWQLAKIKKEYADATHNCYAYILNTNQQIARFSDDGEPQGSAGIPMLEVLKKRNINKTLVVVTRYFGGVKLGVGGLLSAYSGCVSDALDDSDIVEYRMNATYRIRFDYQIVNKIGEIAMQYGKLLKVDYEGVVSAVIAVSMDKCDSFTACVIDASLGRAEIQLLERGYVGYKM